MNNFIVQLFNEVDPTAWWTINRFKFHLEEKSLASVSMDQMF